MTLPIKTARTMQLVTLALLVTSFAQITYWIVDEAKYMERELDAKLERCEHAAVVAQTMLDDGHSSEEVLAHFPSLVMADGIVRVDQDFVADLVAARRRRLIRYGSEGTFLLLVFIGGIATLTRSLRQSTELMRRQENFVAAVSHEFKTPLASLKLSAETMLLREVSIEDQHKLANRMVEDTDRLESMVTNILRAGMVAEGRLDLSPENLTLVEIIEHLTQRHESLAHLQKVQVKTKLDPQLGISCDRSAFMTILDNLLSNAIKSVASQGGGIVSVLAEPQGDRVRIDIVDNGCGFATSETRKLFEKFYRPGEEIRRTTKGTGLGLFVVKSLVEGCGGRVDARSDGEGKGATFSLWMPRARVGVL